MPTDTRLQADVLEAILASATVAPNAIEVAVRDGVVTLAGQVDSLPARYAVVRAAFAVRGVRALADEIVVRLGGGPTAASDEEIAHAAADALMRDTEVPSHAVTARVHHGHLWLDGDVDTPGQRAAAERAVEGIAGVRSVGNLLRVRPGVGAHA